jgi:hypothetical protein
MEVKSFLLQTGQEIIAEIVAHSSSDEKWTIHNPLAVHIMQGPDGKPQLGFAPISMIHKTDVDIVVHRTSLLLEPVEVEEAVASSYIQQQTGLIVAPTALGKQILHS